MQRMLDVESQQRLFDRLRDLFVDRRAYSVDPAECAVYAYDNSQARGDSGCGGFSDHA
ncbi:MAG: hypothetical protein V9G29_13940 [Burkholderiaceae bacterium]